MFMTTAKYNIYAKKYTSRIMSFCLKSEIMDSGDKKAGCNN